MENKNGWDPRTNQQMSLDPKRSILQIDNILVGHHHHTTISIQYLMCCPYLAYNASFQSRAWSELIRKRAEKKLYPKKAKVLSDVSNRKGACPIPRSKTLKNFCVVLYSVSSSFIVFESKSMFWKFFTSFHHFGQLLAWPKKGGRFLVTKKGDDHHNVDKSFQKFKGFMAPF